MRFPTVEGARAPPNPPLYPPLATVLHTAAADDTGIYTVFISDMIVLGDRRLDELAKGSEADPRRRLLASCGSELGGSGIVYMLLRASLHGPAAQGVVVIT